MGRAAIVAMGSLDGQGEWPAVGRGDALWCVIDVETTGLGASSRIVEVAFERLADDGTIVDACTTVVNPGRETGASWVHGLTREDVADAPGFADVAGVVEQALRDCVPVAHNLAFDWAVLRREYARLGVHAPPSGHGVCTLALARAVLGQRCRLDRACVELGLDPGSDRHRAASDVRATAALFLALRERVRVPRYRVLAPFPGSWRLRVDRSKLRPRQTGRTGQEPGPSLGAVPGGTEGAGA